MPTIIIHIQLYSVKINFMRYYSVLVERSTLPLYPPLTQFHDMINDYSSV